MNKPDPVSSNVYNRDYYLKHRGGSDTFLRSKGKELYTTHSYAIRLAEKFNRLQPSARVLDMGCGCGEIALNVATQVSSVLAVDYSRAAIDLAEEAKKTFNADIQSKVTFFCASADDFDLKEDEFDIIFFLDVIEHLVQEQIDSILHSLYRSLKKGGIIIVHTWPNRWHRQFTYPLTYQVGRLSGNSRPNDARTEHEKSMHVMEQSPMELRLNLRRAGFKTKVFLHHVRSKGRSPREWLHYFIHVVPPLKWVFCDYIWAIGTK